MKLKNLLLENTKALIQKVDAFSDTQFLEKPDPRSWSAAEVLEHLYRSEFGIPKLFTGETKPVTHRAPDAYVIEMEDRFLKSDKKMKASGVILPSGKNLSKAELIEKFRQNREKIAELIDQLPPEELCLKYEHPIFGLLTRMEWVHFSIIHTKRHMSQLDRIQSEI